MILMARKVPHWGPVWELVYNHYAKLRGLAVPNITGYAARVRPEGGAATLIGVELGVGHADPDAFDEGVDPEFVAICRKALAARLPALGEATMRGGWAGMIMMSADGRPIIDQIPAVAGLYCMLGDSGTSFKTSPAIGKCLAEWIVDGKPKTVDLTPFRAARFAEDRPWQDPDNYGLDGLTISR